MGRRQVQEWKISYQTLQTRLDQKTSSFESDRTRLQSEIAQLRRERAEHSSSDGDDDDKLVGSDHVEEGIAASNGGRHHLMFEHDSSHIAPVIVRQRRRCKSGTVVARIRRRVGDQDSFVRFWHYLNSDKTSIAPAQSEFVRRIGGVETVGNHLAALRHPMPCEKVLETVWQIVEARIERANVEDWMRRRRLTISEFVFEFMVLKFVSSNAKSKATFACWELLRSLFEYREKVAIVSYSIV